MLFIIPMFEKKSLNIAMVSDYFYPNKGGVETHIKTISEELIKMGHSVIIITHKYDDFDGIIYLGNLKIYYLDIPILALNTTFPTIFSNYAIFYEIFRHNKIDIVHGHQSLSNLCLESIYHASILNISTVLTDHSVFELDKFERIIVDELTSFMCKNLDYCICVSETALKNTLKRIKINSKNTCVIPNGFSHKIFYPKTTRYEKGSNVTVIFMSRLTFRKGLDLLLDAIPLICKNKKINILVLGDGPKKNEVEQIIFDNDLQDQVKILDPVKHEETGDILRSGDIFLNTSLTETFCMAILESASCGLRIVSTNVGGIFEVLPPGTIYFTKPTAEDISDQINNAIKDLENHNINEIYRKTRAKYDWTIITKKIEDIYLKCSAKKNSYQIVFNQQREQGFLCKFATFYQYFQMWLLNKLWNM